MSDLDKFTRLKKRVAEAQREADKATGALESAMKRLKEEFACTTIEEAQKLLEEQIALENACAEAFRNSLKKYEEKWGAFLGS